MSVNVERGRQVAAPRPPVIQAPPDDLEKYFYTKRSLPYLTTVLTIGFVSVTVSQIFMEEHIRAALVLVPFTALYAAYQLISLPVNFTGRKFDINAHRKLVDSWWPRAYPAVDIYLPICGEPIEVLNNTWIGVARLLATYPGQAIAYVLDDGDDEKARALAASFGFTYVVRENRGWFRKAGNLRYAFERTNGEFFVILDADFAPRSDFLEETLPYLEDPDIAIVQTPQFFRTTPEQTWVERGGGVIQEVFYRSIQVARDRFGAAICVGTCAVYRRSALEPHGGPALIDYAEDVHTGLDVHKDGKRLVYVPVNLATGMCPDNVHPFVHQQIRWCTGNMFTVILSRLWEVPMTPRTRLSHISGFCYYLSSAIAVFTVPLAPVLLLVFAPGSVRLSNLILFGPSLWTGMVMYPLWHQGDYRLRDVLPLTVIRGWAHVLAIWDYVRGRTLKWQPSGAKVSRVRRLWWGLIIWNGGISVAWLGLTGWRIEQTHSYEFLVTGLTGMLSAIVTGRAIYSMTQRAQARAARAPQPRAYRRERPAGLSFAAAMAAVILVVGGCVAGGAYYVHSTARAVANVAHGPVHLKVLASAPLTVSHPLIGMYGTGLPQSLSPLTQFNSDTGLTSSVALYYNDWGQPFGAGLAEYQAARGGYVLVDLDPTGTNRLADIVDGQEDAYLKAYAESVMAYAGPVIIAFGHEMNGNWYGWGAGHAAPSQFVAAWRHVVKIFRSVGAKNVTWMWTVNSTGIAESALDQWWPGSQWVNWVGVDGYYYYSTNTYNSVFGQTIDQIRTFTNDPIMIAETGVGMTSDRESQIAGLFAGAEADHVRGLVWFNVDQNDGIYHQDWELENDAAALAEFKEEAKAYQETRT